METPTEVPGARSRSGTGGIRSARQIRRGWVGALPRVLGPGFLSLLSVVCSGCVGGRIESGLVLKFSSVPAAVVCAWGSWFDAELAVSLRQVQGTAATAGGPAERLSWRAPGRFRGWSGARAPVGAAARWVSVWAARLMRGRAACLRAGWCQAQSTVASWVTGRASGPLGEASAWGMGGPPSAGWVSWAARLMWACRLLRAGWC